MSDGPCENTDRELWRERDGDYYADSIHVTKEGSIGINCGGYVVVMPVRKWHALAKAPDQPDATPCIHCGGTGVIRMEGVGYPCPNRCTADQQSEATNGD
jgi:hypothetical protein